MKTVCCAHGSDTEVQTVTILPVCGVVPIGSCVIADRDVGPAGDSAARKAPWIPELGPGAQGLVLPGGQPIGLPQITPGMTGRHVLSVDMFTREQVRVLLPVVQRSSSVHGLINAMFSL